MTPTPPDRPTFWGQGLPPPDTRQRTPIHPFWRAAWIIWCVAWALFWITAGWFIIPLVNLLAFGVSLAAILAFDRMPLPGQLPPRRRGSPGVEPVSATTLHTVGRGTAASSAAWSSAWPSWPASAGLWLGSLLREWGEPA